MRPDVDPFISDGLPPRSQWPDFRFTRAELHYPDRLNAATEPPGSKHHARLGNARRVSSPMLAYGPTPSCCKTPIVSRTSWFMTTALSLGTECSSVPGTRRGPSVGGSRA